VGFLFGRRKNTAGLDKSDEQYLIRQAQQGNQAIRDALLEQYTPFAIKVSARVSGRYLTLGQDDEVSISLIALNEAIDSFQVGKGASFTTFAETVIRRRLIDYFRKEKQQKEIPLTTLQGDPETEGDTWQAVEAKAAEKAYALQTAATERQEEIVRYQKILREYGIAFADLVAISPRHQDARLRAMEAAKIVASKQEYRDYLQQKKLLPLKDLETEVAISRKTLERQRKYIIAISLILIEDFTYLKEYIHL